MDSLVFGQRLRYFRKRNGYTLTELGKLINRPAPCYPGASGGDRERARCRVGGVEASRS